MNAEYKVEGIVKQWLRDNGYDGLYNDDCGCTLDDFAPCGEICGDCVAGYITSGAGEFMTVGPKGGGEE